MLRKSPSAPRQYVRQWYPCHWHISIDDALLIHCTVLCADKGIFNALYSFKHLNLNLPALVPCAIFIVLICTVRCLVIVLTVLTRNLFHIHVQPCNLTFLTNLLFQQHWKRCSYNLCNLNVALLALRLVAPVAPTHQAYLRGRVNSYTRIVSQWNKRSWKKFKLYSWELYARPGCGKHFWTVCRKIGV